MKPKLSLLVCLLLIVASCQNKKPKKEVEKEDVSANLLQYAKNLRIFDYGSIVKIEIINQEKGAVIFATELVREKRLGNSNSINVPIKKMAALSATQVGMLGKLKAYKHLSATIDKKYIYDKDLKHFIQLKKIHELATETGVSTEQLIASGSKFVLYDDFGTGFTDEDKLKQLGITCIPVGDWQEQHPLGKAEWILLYGYLTGKEKEAKAIFLMIEKNYNKLKEIAKKQKRKPSLISGNLITDIWYAPAKNSYNARLFADAGGKYVYANETSSKPSIEKSMEQILSENKKTEIWINPGFSSKKAIKLHAQKTSLLHPFKTGKVYCYSHNMNLFWERSAIEPHFVLEDLIRIMHPKALPKGKFHFYKKVK